MGEFASAVRANKNIASDQIMDKNKLAVMQSYDYSQFNFGSLAIQPKLKVSQPGDPYEQEADRIAGNVMRMPAFRSTALSLQDKHEVVARKCTACKMNGEEDDEKLEISRKPSIAANLEVTDSVVGNINNIRLSAGSHLDADTREFMESRFGFDFSRVRIHTGEAAEKSASSVNALAYTAGNDIIFAKGQYRPNTIQGRKLLAHELTHVVQQDGMKSNSTYLIQRASEVCEMVEMNTQETTRPVVYDYEEQVCRPAEPDEVDIVAPESDGIDGEFWIMPSDTREGLKPIYDDEETGVIVGFRYSSGGYYEIYDLHGTLVETGEPGLESPLIDPIDILAGGLTGLGRGLLRGGGRAAARGVAGGAGRGVASGLARTGLVATIKILSRRAATAIRAVYRAIRFRGALNFTTTTVARMADPARRVPHHILKIAIRYGSRSPDPQGVSGAFRYTIQMFRNGKAYELEVVLREADQTVLHFLYR